MPKKYSENTHLDSESRTDLPTEKTYKCSYDELGFIFPASATTWSLPMQNMQDTATTSWASSFLLLLLLGPLSEATNSRFRV